MKSQLKKFREYLDYVERHYDNVQKAWSILKSKCKNMRFIYDDYYYHTIETNVLNHDLSKLSSEEFTQYRQFFYPTDDEEPNKELFLQAWEHHKEKNPHHWQNWTNKTYPENSPMPEIYLVENIIDWMAMGYEFGDTAKDYYENNKEKIDMPEWAIRLMYEVFDRIY